MSLRTPVLFALMAALTTACGGESKSDSDAAAPDTGASAETSDAGDSADATDAAGDIKPSDTAVQDTGAPKPDIAPAGKSCSSILGCALPCDGDAACVTKCANDGTADAKAGLKAFTDCAVDLCKDATDTTSKRACAMTKCWDQLSKCGEFGAGENACADTAICAGRCFLGDAACVIRCAQAAGKDAAAAWKDLAACGEKQCGAEADPDKRAACLVANCQTPANTCRGAAGLDCLATSACYAKCPPPLPGKVHQCAGTCKLLASATGSQQWQDYQACKDKCKGARDLNCVAATCSKERAACFPGSGGTDNCQALYTCIKSKCQGIGGKPECIAECVKKGSGVAQDAFVHYEGCMLSVVETNTLAKDHGCEFPYDEETCITKVGGLCNSQSANCFKAQ
jgi:hypothetical protein